jgi:hypothetical protein
MVDRNSDHDVEAASKGESYTFVSVVSNNNDSSDERSVPTSVELDMTTTTKSIDASTDLQGQLELAKKEIARLKYQISNIAERSAEMSRLAR